MTEENPRRAITLAGGGPAAGLHIGALRALQDNNIEFKVWALSCIGAWVGIVYNQWTDGAGNWTAPNDSWTDPHGNWIDRSGHWNKPVGEGKDKAQRTLNFFRKNVFRENHSYSRFPLNQVFAPDLKALGSGILQFLIDPHTAKNLWLPNEALEAFVKSVFFWFDPKNWLSEGDLNYWALNQFFAVHPISRFLTSLIYLSPVNGLSRIYYADSSFLKFINIDNLSKQGQPFIFHNAWNLKERKIQLFSNFERNDYKKLTHQSLCACSALPYVEETITIKDEKDPMNKAKWVTYCEGALVDTVNFRDLLEKHGKELDEIWVSRIVDVSQAKPPVNIKDALGNLCMLFAGSLGDDDVRLFKYHARDEGWTGEIYELNYFPSRSKYGGEETKNSSECEVGFDWNLFNFDNGLKRGFDAANALINLYRCFEYYKKHRYEEAYKHAESLAGVDALSKVARAITFVRNDKVAEARHAIENLVKMDRAWRKYPRLELGKTFYEEKLLDRILKDLDKAGLGEEISRIAEAPAG